MRITKKIKKKKKNSQIQNKMLYNDDVLKKILKDVDHYKIAVLYLDIVNFSNIKCLYGKPICSAILENLQKTIALVAPKAENFIISGYMYLGGDDAVLYAKTSLHTEYTDLCNYAAAIHQQAEIILNTKGLQNNLPQVQLHIGYSFVSRKQNPSEDILYLALKEALQTAKSDISISQRKQIEELKKILVNKNIRSVFQPIVSLKTGKIFGYEALTRGPENSSLHMPGVLFPLAEKAGLLYLLENIARQTAITTFAAENNDFKLFINLNANVINDPNFSGGITKALLEQFGMEPRNIVWEITERSSINDFDSFRRALEHYRSQGYRIAIDDAGAGYSSLQTIAEIHPDFIKMDMSLINGISKSPIKKALMETFVTFAGKINSSLIAEGIETEDDLMEIYRMGVQYAQGFFLARPEYPPLPDIPEKIKLMLEKNSHMNDILTQSSGIRAINLIEKTYTCLPDTQGKKIIEVFKKDAAVNSIVIEEEGKFIGILPRERTFLQLSSQYGFSLYGEKLAIKLKSSDPLIVDSKLPLMSLAEKCNQRPYDYLNEDIVVCENDNYLGIIPVRKLFDAMSNIRMEIAKCSNPLTNLPGGPVIQEKLRIALAEGGPFAAAYADLDNFKAYNDYYGFDRGDDVIKFTSNLLFEALQIKGSGCGFLGHIGGDDFFLMENPSNIENICNYVIEQFDKKIIELYDSKEKELGGINGQNRDGAHVFFPFCSISIAVVADSDKKFNDYQEITELLAILKKYAKKISGSNFVRDRRRNYDESDVK